MLQTSPISSNSEATNTITREFAMDLSIHEVCHTSKEKLLIQLMYLYRREGERKLAKKWTIRMQNMSSMRNPGCSKQSQYYSPNHN